MAMESINPATGERLKTFSPWSTAQLEQALALAARATPGWQATPFSERARLLRAAAEELRANAADYAALITLEMGKLIKEARAEVDPRAAEVAAFRAPAGGGSCGPVPPTLLEP